METYSEMELAAELQKALDALKFIEPTKIQSTVIPRAMQGKDLMACAETGSGKTAAYGIPLVASLLRSPQKHALVLAPTRELAQQIADFLRELTAYCRDLNVVTLVGGADMRRQIKSLQKKPRIVVATPGRLIDHLQRRSIRLANTEILVLDEGDRMLDMGFAPQLDEILRHLPQKRQTSLFTATLPLKVRKLAEKYLHNPEMLDVGRTSLPVKKIKQAMLQVSSADKNDKIVEELNARSGSIIVFCRTQRRVDALSRVLSSLGFLVELIHGGRSQGQRNKAILNFKKGKSRILCATDVAARGIDIPSVEHVINFDLPTMTEDYVHRIGRTARNGASGEALSFVSPEEEGAWNSLVKKYEIEGLEIAGVRAGKAPAHGRRAGGRPGGTRPSGRPSGRPGRRSEGGRSEGGRRGEERSFGGRSTGSRSFGGPARTGERSGERSYAAGGRSQERSFGDRRSAPKSSASGERSPSAFPPKQKKSYGQDFEKREYSKFSKKPASRNSESSQGEKPAKRPFKKRPFASAGGPKKSGSFRGPGRRPE